MLGFGMRFGCCAAYPNAETVLVAWAIGTASPVCTRTMPARKLRVKRVPSSSVRRSETFHSSPGEELGDVGAFLKDPVDQSVPVVVKA